MHPPRQAVASSPWRRAGSGEWLTQGEWGPGIRWGVSRTPSSRPQGDGRLPLARLQGCSGLARLHACVLLGTGSQPPPWCRVEPLQEDLERAPGSGQALRAAVTGTGQGRRAVSSLLVRLVSGAIKHARFSSPCPTLCDPIDGSPPGSPVPGILQERTLEWVAISFSNA